MERSTLYELLASFITLVESKQGTPRDVIGISPLMYFLGSKL